MSETTKVENTTEKLQSILDMAMGAIKERTDYEMTQIIENIQDTNYPAEKERTMTIKVKFKPDDSRRQISVETEVSTKLVAMSAVKTMLFAVNGKDGERVYKEATVQSPGQMDLFGGVQPEPATLKLVK